MEPLINYLMDAPIGFFLIAPIIAIAFLGAILERDTLDNLTE